MNKELLFDNNTGKFFQTEKILIDKECPDTEYLLDTCGKLHEFESVGAIDTDHSIILLNEGAYTLLEYAVSEDGRLVLVLELEPEEVGMQVDKVVNLKALGIVKEGV